MSTTSPRTGGTVPDRRQGTTLAALTWLLGLWLITWGIISVLVTLWIRHAGRQAASAR